MSRARALSLIERLQAAGVRPTGVQADSRRVQPGDVFVAWPGARADARQHLAEAVESGAVAVLWEAGDGFEAGALSRPSFGVEGLQEISGWLAHELLGQPSSGLWLAGVTGTNGKTTVSQWVAQALAAVGERCGVIGTLGVGEPGRLAPLANTTPVAVELHGLLAGLRDEGLRAVAMEVSSIGLAQERVQGVEFDVAVFTNLSRDHLDFHGTMEAYAQAKARFFSLPGLRQAVINLDDAFGAREATRAAAAGLEVLGYTLENVPSPSGMRVLSVQNIEVDGGGQRFRLSWQGETALAQLAAVGRFNVANAAAVIGVLLLRGVSLAEAARALAKLTPPPGRMQCLGGQGEPLVIVDYAHTPDALEKTLQAARAVARSRAGRLVCVFGCGGERDGGKRRLMGEVAARLADSVTVTSDNPRGESPQAIAEAVLAGAGAQATCELDRACAIAAALAHCAAEDVLVVAGKGHENYQEVRGERLPFSDVEQAESALRARRAGAVA